MASENGVDLLLKRMNSTMVAYRSGSLNSLVVERPCQVDNFVKIGLVILIGEQQQLFSRTDADTP